MRFAIAVIFALGVASVWLSASPTPARAEPVCASAMAPHIDWAQGVAFIGVVDSATKAERGWDYQMEIERVVVPHAAGPTLPAIVADSVVTISSFGCGPIRNLEPGHRYLITSDPGNSGFGSLYTVVWEISVGRVSLVKMYHGRALDCTIERGCFRTVPDASIAGVRTLDAAIYLVVNGALPETDMATPINRPSEPASDGLGGWVLVFAMTGVAMLALDRRIRRTAT